MWKWITDLWSKKREPELQILEHPHNRIRRKVDINSIRARIQGLGWKILEVPIKHSNPDPAKRTIIKWKVVAIKGQSSCEVTGLTIEEAMKNIGETLGVIAKEKK
jgi:hypothetical protein